MQLNVGVPPGFVLIGHHSVEVVLEAWEFFVELSLREEVKNVEQFEVHEIEIGDILSADVGRITLNFVQISKLRSRDGHDGLKLTIWVIAGASG